MIVLLHIAIFCIIYFPLVLWQSYVGQTLWNMLIVPIWNVEPITVSHAIVVFIMWSYINTKFNNKKEESESKHYMYSIMVGFLWPLAALFFGFLWSLLLVT